MIALNPPHMILVAMDNSDPSQIRIARPSQDAEKPHTHIAFAVSSETTVVAVEAPQDETYSVLPVTQQDVMDDDEFSEYEDALEKSQQTQFREEQKVWMMCICAATGKYEWIDADIAQFQGFHRPF